MDWETLFDSRVSVVLPTYSTCYVTDKLYSDYKGEKQNPFLGNTIFSNCFLVFYSFYVSHIKVYTEHMKWYSNNLQVIGSNSIQIRSDYWKQLFDWLYHVLFMAL